MWVVGSNNGMEQIMTKAKAIEVLANNAADAVELAEKYAVSADQDWSECSTLFVFDDNSVLVCSGTSYFAREGETD